MNPFGSLLARLRRTPERPKAPSPPPLPPDMGAGAAQFQLKLDEARERLRRDIPAPSDEE